MYMSIDLKAWEIFKYLLLQLLRDGFKYPVEDRNKTIHCSGLHQKLVEDLCTNLINFCISSFIFMFMLVLYFPLRLFDRSNSLAYFNAVLFAKLPLLFLTYRKDMGCKI